MSSMDAVQLEEIAASIQDVGIRLGTFESQLREGVDPFSSGPGGA